VTPRLIVRPEAEADMAEAHAWYEARSSGLGEEFLDAVAEALTAVEEAPQRFPTVHREGETEVRRAHLRRFPFGLFFVQAAGEASRVTVIACLHARRDPQRWTRRL
jgi:plasmid stabilization system protein ParE